MRRRVGTPGMAGIGMVSAFGPGGVNGAVGGAAPGWWDPNAAGLCIWAAYQAKGVANLAASYVDLSGNGNNAGVGVAPAWDAVNGWKFNGIAHFLTTTFVPQMDQSQTMIVQFTNRTGGFAANKICGSYGGAGLAYFFLRSGFGGSTYCNGGVRSLAPAIVFGNLAVAGNQGYMNGVPHGAAIAAWTAAGAAAYIGCWNNGGPADYMPIYIQAFALYDCALTGGQVAAVEAAMAAL